jgi:Nucleotide modification associated domain 1
LTNNTTIQYDIEAALCREVFVKKTKDYGTSWRVMRSRSLTDQLFIKAQRIKTLEENDTRKVDEGIEPEFMGIVNYALMGLIQLSLGDDAPIELSEVEAARLYDAQLDITRSLMLAKNHDYGEAWRDMRVSSFTDLILMKLLRIKQIEDNGGKTLISEGIDAGYMDIANYAFFALIQLHQKDTTT